MKMHATPCLAAITLVLSACSATAPREDVAPPSESLMFIYGVGGGESRDGGEIGVTVGLDYSSRGEGGLGWEAGVSYSRHDEFLGS